MNVLGLLFGVYMRFVCKHHKSGGCHLPLFGDVYVVEEHIANL